MTGVLCIMSVTGCAKNPEKSIVKNKDMDNLIEEAKNTDGQGVEIDSIADKYDTYKTSIYDENLRCKVNVDAKVTIPHTSQLSVFRVGNSKVTQELADKFMNYFMKDEKLYDGSALFSVTRAAVEDEIDMVKYNINYYMEGYKNAQSQEDKEYWKSEADKEQQELAKLKNIYENAPNDIAYENYPTDCKLTGTLEMKNREQNSNVNQDYEIYTFDVKCYEWQYSLNKDGEVLFVTNDSDSGNYKTLYVQNNKDYGNCIRYRSGKNGHIKVTGAMMDVSDMDNDETIWQEGGQPTYAINNPDIVLKEFSNEKLTISEEEAKETAQQFVTDMGLGEHMMLYSCDKYNEIVMYEGYTEDKDENYRQEYILRYLRNIDGAFINYSEKYKLNSNENGSSKKSWPQEILVLRVNDDGVVGVDYNAPLEIRETVVDKSNIKDFSEIKDAFEKTVTMLYASETDVERVVNINKVELGYALISEQDSYDTGLLVPVWDFYGEFNDSVDGNQLFGQKGDLVTINAIDASIINRDNGY